MPKPKPKDPAKAIPQNEDKVESKNKVKTAEERGADRKDKKVKAKKVTPKKKKQFVTNECPNLMQQYNLPH